MVTKINPDGTPTLNGHMGGKMYDAYRDTIQAHVNGLDPQLGATYQGLNDEYKVASNASRAIGNRDEGSLTSMLQRGLGSPSTVEDVSNAPAPRGPKVKVVRTEPDVIAVVRMGGWPRENSVTSGDARILAAIA